MDEKAIKILTELEKYLEQRRQATDEKNTTDE